MNPDELRKWIETDGVYNVSGTEALLLAAADAWEITEHQLRDAYTAMESLKTTLLETRKRLEATHKLWGDESLRLRKQLEEAEKDARWLIHYAMGGGGNIEDAAEFNRIHAALAKEEK